MDREQARFVLGACQPNGIDDKRPEAAEALEAARRDPELEAWLDRERASDSAIARKMRELEPPAKLHACLMVGARASRRPSKWRRWTMPLGMAAAFVVGIGIATAIRPPGYMVDETTPTLAAWEKSCVGIFAHPFFSLDFIDEEYPPLEAHLVSGGARVVGKLPFTDGVTTALGCSVLQWRGATVSLACFNSESGELVHLFAMPSHHLEDAGSIARRQRGQVGSFATVTWKQGDLVLLVASRLPAGELDRLLDRQAPAFASALVATSRQTRGLHQG